MAAKTGSTYLRKHESRVRFSIAASSKRVSLGDFNNDRQLEMVAEIGNTYISETITDSVEIPTAIWGSRPL